MRAEKLTPKELIQKHIADKTHVVTEDELKNVLVGFVQDEAFNKFSEVLSKQSEVDGLLSKYISDTHRR